MKVELNEHGISANAKINGKGKTASIMSENTADR